MEHEWELNETDLFDLYGCSSTLVARAANKKLVEWLATPCMEHLDGILPHLDCQKCWAELKKELGVK